MRGGSALLRITEKIHGRSSDACKNHAQRSPGFHIKLVSTVLYTSLLAGCVVGPDYERPNLLIPATWSGNAGKIAAQPAELSQWWTRFNDPLLTALVSQAIENNRSVVAAKARASLRQETANLLPTGSGAASPTGLEHPLART